MSKFSDLLKGKVYPAIDTPLECSQLDKKTGAVKTVWYGKVKTTALTGAFTRVCRSIEEANEEAEKLLEEMREAKE